MSTNKVERLKILNPKPLEKGKVLWAEVGTMFFDPKSKKGTLYLNHLNQSFKVVPWEAEAGSLPPEDPEYLKSLEKTEPPQGESGDH